MKVPRNESSKKYQVIGLGLSLSYFVVVGFYIHNSQHDLLELEPNELGDFIAGILGPVGILWLILGFWQQGDELRSSVRALELQSEELRNSVEQQKQLVEVTRLQVQSEIDAQQEERAARLEARLPKLHLSNDGGSQSGLSITSRLRLINLGADCVDLKVFDLDQEFPSMIFSKSSMKNGEEFSFPVSHSINDHLDFDLEIRFRTTAGEHEGILFSLSRPASNAVGFTIESN